MNAIISLARTQLIQVTIAIAIAIAIAAVAVIAALLGRRRPHLAYALWLAVLIKCLIPPVWSSPTGLFSWAARQEAAHATTIAPMISRDDPPRPAADLIPPVQLPSVQRTLSTPAPHEPPQRHISWNAVLVVGWLIGVAIALLVPLARSRSLRRRIEQSASPLPDELSHLLDHLRNRLGVRQDVRLIVADLPVSPALIGIIRPVIVLPATMLHGSDQQLESALAHELTHLRRRDHWIAALQWLAVSIWWFHPLVWWMSKQVSRTRELSCDEEVIAALHCEPCSYAQMLLDVLKLSRGQQPQALSIGVSSMRITARRLDHIMKNSARFHRRTPIACRMILLIAMMLLLPGAAITLRAEPPATTTATTNATTAPAQAMTFNGGVFEKGTNKPIAGATVKIRREIHEQDNMLPGFGVTEHQTDAAGQFTFTVPPEQAAAKLYLELDVSHPKYASRNGEGYGLALIKRDLELGNQPWFHHIDLVPGDEVTGVIEDESGKPLADIPIQFSSVAGPYDRRFLAEDRADGKTKTDATGRFRFNAIKGAGITDFWAEPDDRAILFHSIRDQRGDLGTFRLEAGIKINGTIVDSAGKPVPRADLALESIEKNDVQWEVSQRTTTADDAGHFEFKPVKPGAYQIKVNGMIAKTPLGDVHTSKLPGAFTPIYVTAEYRDYNKFPPVEVKAIPHVTVRAQYVDSKGQPTRGHGVDLYARRDGGGYIARGRIDDKGVIEMLVPKGMTEAKLLISTDPYSALRFRRGETGELHAGSEIPLGTLDKDATDVVIVRYKAPTLVVRALSPDGKPAPDFRPRIDYPPGTVPPKNGQWFHEIKGDVYFEKQDDGSWRSSQLLPGVEFTVTATAKGQASAPQKLKLNEDETREIKPTLAPSTEPAEKMEPASQPSK